MLCARRVAHSVTRMFHAWRVAVTCTQRNQKKKKNPHTGTATPKIIPGSVGAAHATYIRGRGVAPWGGHSATAEVKHAESPKITVKSQFKRETSGNPRPPTRVQRAGLTQDAQAVVDGDDDDVAVARQHAAVDHVPGALHVGAAVDVNHHGLPAARVVDVWRETRGGAGRSLPGLLPAWRLPAHTRFLLPIPTYFLFHFLLHFLLHVRPCDPPNPNSGSASRPLFWRHPLPTLLPVTSRSLLSVPMWALLPVPLPVLCPMYDPPLPTSGPTASLAVV
ncbi:hypothetical protein NN561_019611 [Cricetulus griseus]